MLSFVPIFSRGTPRASPHSTSMPLRRYRPRWRCLKRCWRSGCCLDRCHTHRALTWGRVTAGGLSTIDARVVAAKKKPITPSLPGSKLRWPWRWTP